MRIRTSVAATLLAAASVLTAWVLTACGASDETAMVAICDSPDGSWTNLNSEPDGFRSDSSARVDWTDEAGCAINLNYIFHRFGDDHCGWQDAEFISIGIPIGSPYTTPSNQDWEPLFFHNTNGVVADETAGTVLTELPDDATDTGLRAASGRELWASASQDTLFIREDEMIFEFVSVADEDVSCA